MSDIAYFRGPWLGMEQRESFQTDQHCELAYNIDFSRGYIEARPGLKRVSGEDFQYSHRVLASHDVKGQPRRFLVVGPVFPDSSIQLTTLDGDWDDAVATDLTATYGEPYETDFTCSFVRTTLGDGHFVTLIVTKYNTYVYDPQTNPLTVRLLSPATDALKANSLNYFYWVTRPKGKYACWHNGRVYYAGFDSEYEILMDGTLAASQSQVKESWVLAGRSSFRVGPHVVAFSDQFDPAGIQAPSVYSTDESESITGLRSFGENLVVFTEKSIYMQVGDPGTQNSQLVKVVAGTGCAAGHAIEEADGLLYFLSTDGLYSFDGGAVKKLTEGVDGFFSGRIHGSHTPEAFNTAFNRVSWKFDTSKLYLSGSVHWRERNLLLFSLTVLNDGQTDDGAFSPIVLAYNYRIGAISFWKAADGTPFMVSNGVSVVTQGKERIYVFASSKSDIYGRDFVSEFRDYHPDSMTNPISNVSFPVVWLSARHFKASEEHKSFRRPRFRLLSWGKNLATVKYTLTGEESAFDAELEGVANTDRQEASGTLDIFPINKQVNTYFFGTGVFGTATFGPDEWFTSRVDPEPVSSKWCQLGIGDLGNPGTRAPVICMQDYSIEYEVIKGNYR